MVKKQAVWFSVIEFNFQTESYIMITNDVQCGDEEISLAYNNSVIEEFQFDGPHEWTEQMQDFIDRELEELVVEFFEYKSPCYYREDYNLIRKRYRKILSQFNKDYEFLNTNTP